jgi:hypothetical protein
MTERMTVYRAMHDVGLAAWFGGSLNGAIGVNGAASDVDDPRQRARVANAGWARWTPFNLVAIGAHIVGAVQLARRDSKRVAAQSGVTSNTAVKTALTGAALAATAYSRVLGQRIMAAGDVPVAGGTDPLPQTPPDVAKAQKQLKALQWAIPALTGAIFVSSDLHEEQQRTTEVVKGTLQALPARAATAVTAPVAAAAAKVKDAV